jgi:hypothetical protein
MSTIGRWWLLVALLSAGACNSGGSGSNVKPAPAATQQQAPPSQPKQSTASAAAAAVPEPERDFRHPTSERLIALGDLHGDLSAARAALRLGGAIDADDRWVGGSLTVVQTGDQIDRGDGDRDVLDLLERLEKEASAAGGRVIVLNGNHEIMNVQGDFRYVTPGAVSPFAGASPRSPLARNVKGSFAERALAFLPGGEYALKMAERDVVAVVGDSVFAHGGVLPEHVSYGIARLNAETRRWMRNGPATAPEIVASERGPVWIRDFSVDPVSDENCAILARSLDALGVRRMVVGHTPQKQGVTSACGDRVYRIDVGLARYYGGPLQILQITPAGVQVLKGR